MPLPRLLAIPLLLLLTSCAAVFSPHPQPVPVDTRPPGADVYVNGVHYGTTPLTLELDARESVDVLLRLGDAERRITLASSVDGAYVALDLVPGLALAGASLWLMHQGNAGPTVDSFAEFAALTGGAAGVAVGVGSATIAVGVDAATRRWYRLSPTEIVVEFEGP